MTSADLIYSLLAVLRARFTEGDVQVMVGMVQWHEQCVALIDDLKMLGFNRRCLREQRWKVVGGG